MHGLAALDFFSSALLTSARAARVTAADLANSDTPGYDARGLDFDAALTARLSGKAPVDEEYVRGLAMNLDGNDVSLPYEGVQSAADGQRLRESLAFLQMNAQSLLTALNPQGNTAGG